MARKAPDDGLTKHQRYARTRKGQERNRRWEERHPERRGRNRTGFIARDVTRGGDRHGTQGAEGAG